MGYTYIGKALGAVAGLGISDPNMNLCDEIAFRLTEMNSVQRSLADTAASFIRVNQQKGASDWWHGRGRDMAPEYTKNLRRAALLLKELFSDHARAIRDDHSASWDPTLLRAYVIDIRNRIIANPRITRDYLRGSFWAYASPGEREHAQAALTELPALLNAGVTAAQLATPPALALQRRWFGITPPAAILANMQTLNTGFLGNNLGLNYQGPGATGNRSGLAEFGQGANQPHLGGDVAAAPPLNVGSGRWNTDKLCLGPRFFHSVRAHRGPHNLTLNATNITRAGALLHELTHRFLNTDDVRVNATDLLNALFDPNVHQILIVNQVAYGAAAAHALTLDGAAGADRAFRNADNYRLFCEDALHL